MEGEIQPISKNENFDFEYKFGRTFLSFRGDLLLNPNKEFVKEIKHFQTGVLITKTKLYNGEIFDEKAFEIYQFINNHGKSLFEVESMYEAQILVKVRAEDVLLQFVFENHKAKTKCINYNGRMLASVSENNVESSQEMTL